MSCVSYFLVISLFVAHQLYAERSQQQMRHASLEYAPISQRQVSRDVSCGAIGGEGGWREIVVVFDTIARVSPYLHFCVAFRMALERAFFYRFA